MATFADVAEGVRATLAAYVHALDDGAPRTSSPVLPRRRVRDPGQGTYEGHDALRAAYEGWKPERPAPPRPQHPRERVDDDEARALSDVVFLVRIDGAWTTRLVGRYDDTLHRDATGGDPPTGGHIRALTPATPEPAHSAEVGHDLAHEGLDLDGPASGQPHTSSRSRRPATCRRACGGVE